MGMGRNGRRWKIFSSALPIGSIMTLLTLLLLDLQYDLKIMMLMTKRRILLAVYDWRE